MATVLAFLAALGTATLEIVTYVAQHPFAQGFAAGATTVIVLRFLL